MTSNASSLYKNHHALSKQDLVSFEISSNSNRNTIMNNRNLIDKHSNALGLPSSIIMPLACNSNNKRQLWSLSYESSTTTPSKRFSLPFKKRRFVLIAVDSDADGGGEEKDGFLDSLPPRPIAPTTSTAHRASEVPSSEDGARSVGSSEQEREQQQQQQQQADTVATLGNRVGPLPPLASTPLASGNNHHAIGDSSGHLQDSAAATAACITPLLNTTTPRQLLQRRVTCTVTPTTSMPRIAPTANAVSKQDDTSPTPAMPMPMQMPRSVVSEPPVRMRMQTRLRSSMKENETKNKNAPAAVAIDVDAATNIDTDIDIDAMVSPGSNNNPRQQQQQLDIPNNSNSKRPTSQHKLKLDAPLPNGCHGRSSRTQSFCRTKTNFRGSNYCKVHYFDPRYRSLVGDEIETKIEIETETDRNNKKDDDDYGGSCHHKTKSSHENEIRAKLESRANVNSSGSGSGSGSVTPNDDDDDSCQKNKIRHDTETENVDSSGNSTKAEEDQQHHATITMGAIAASSEPNLLLTSVERMDRYWKKHPNRKRAPRDRLYRGSTSPSPSSGDNSNPDASDPEEVRCLAISTRGKRCCYCAVSSYGNRYCHRHSSHFVAESSEDAAVDATVSETPGSSRSSEGSSKDASSLESSSGDGESPRLQPPTALSDLSTDLWKDQRVLVSKGPHKSMVGTVVKWRNGWVTVELAVTETDQMQKQPNSTKQTSGLYYHNRRSYELILV